MSRSLSRQPITGFSLIELLVTVLVSTAILGVSLGLIVTQRRQYLNQQAATNTSQTLQAGMEMIGTDIRQAGEQVGNGPGLPVLQLINGGAGIQNELVLQRKLLPQELNVCSDVSAGSNRVTVADKSNAACPFTDGDTNSIPDDVQEWRTFRCQQDGTAGCLATPPINCQQTGGSDQECTWAYIYDPANNRGEFFIYAGEGTDPSNARRYQIKIQGELSNSYRVSGPIETRPKLYLIEQRQYSLSAVPNAVGDRRLQLQLRDAQHNLSYDLVSGIRDFQVQAQLSGGRVVDDLNLDGTPLVDWRTVQTITVNLTAANTGPDAATPPRTISSQFFPRNSSSIP